MFSDNTESIPPAPAASFDKAAVPQIESVEIIELLGKGGMSLVYKVRQLQLQRTVAVKVLSKLSVPGEEGIRRFQKEAKLTLCSAKMTLVPRQ